MNGNAVVSMAFATQMLRQNIFIAFIKKIPKKFQTKLKTFNFFSLSHANNVFSSSFIESWLHILQHTTLDTILEDDANHVATTHKNFKKDKAFVATYNFRRILLHIYHLLHIHINYTSESTSHPPVR